MVKSDGFSDKIIDIVSYFVLAIMAISCILPILHTVSISLSDKSAAMAGQVTFWPVKFTVSSYQAILEDKQFFKSFGNSLLRVALGGTINITMTVLMAYPLSKNKRFFPQRNIYMWFLVFTMLFHGGLVPSYLLISNLNMLDTIWALVLPGAVPVFNVIILMNFFKGIPEELDEAARVDGANPWLMLIKIYLPLAGPCLATVTLFSIVGHWNAFFDGIIYIKTSGKIPLQTYIQQLVVEIRDMSMLSQEEIIEMNKVSVKTFNAAKVFVTMVPVLLVYPFLQKYFVTGLVMGSVKG